MSVVNAHMGGGPHKDEPIWSAEVLPRRRILSALHQINTQVAYGRSIVCSSPSFSGTRCRQCFAPTLDITCTNILRWHRNIRRFLIHHVWKHIFQPYKEEIIWIAEVLLRRRILSALHQINTQVAYGRSIVCSSPSFSGTRCRQCFAPTLDITCTNILRWHRNIRRFLIHHVWKHIFQPYKEEIIWIAEVLLRRRILSALHQINTQVACGRSILEGRSLIRKFT